MSSTRFLNNRIQYGKSYLTEKLYEKPFFLGANGISGKPVEGQPWDLSFNPIICDLNDSSLEEQMILMIHSMYYFSRHTIDSPTLFERLQCLNTRFIDKIADELIPRTMEDVNTIMSAYNLIFLNTSLMISFNTSTIPPKYGNIISKNIAKLVDLVEKLQNDTNLPRRPKAIKAVIAICKLAIWYMKNVHHEIKDNDLELIYTRLIPNLCQGKLDPSVIPCDVDPFYEEITRIHIVEDRRIQIFYQKPKPSICFTEFAEELSDEASDVTGFENINENSLITNKNLSNFKNLMKMLENLGRNLKSKRPSDSEILEDSFKEYLKSKEYIHQCLIIRLDQNKHSKMLGYRLILDYFINKFWARREKRNKDGCILFSSEETEFIFQFVNEVFRSLRILPNRDAEHYTLLMKYVKEYATVLNALRFKEIYSLISKRTAVILSKSADELLKDQYVSNYFVKKECEDLGMITARIIYYLYSKTKSNVILFEVKGPEVWLISECKSIDDASQIPKIRRSTWREALINNRTAKDCLRASNQHKCPNCQKQLKSEYLCVFICKHTLCSSCTTKLIGDGLESYSCPKCGTPVCEYIPSGEVAKICKYFQQ